MSSAVGVSDDLASVEREESNERLEASSVIRTSRKASSVLSLRTKPSSLSFSGKRRGIEPSGEETGTARFEETPRFGITDSEHFPRFWIVPGVVAENVVGEESHR